MARFFKILVQSKYFADESTDVTRYVTGHTTDVTVYATENVPSPATEPTTRGTTFYFLDNRR